MISTTEQNLKKRHYEEDEDESTQNAKHHCHVTPTSNTDLNASFLSTANVAEADVSLQKIDMDKCNKELSDLLRIDSFWLDNITPEEFNRIRELFELGARPNCANENTSGSPFKLALGTKHLGLIDLLIQYGIKPTESKLWDLSTRLKTDPNAFENQAYEKLAKSLMTPESQLALEESIIKKYHSMFNTISEAKNISQKTSKPLMILIGETHEQQSGINSILSESLALYLAFDQLNIKTVMTEAFRTTVKTDPFWHPAYDVYTLISNFRRKKIIEIDKALTRGSVQPAKATTEEGVKLRNTIMSEVACDHSRMHNEDAVALVGSYHLKGLMEETNLNECYHVLPINASDNSIYPLNNYIGECSRYKISEKVTQAQIINNEKPIYISPKMATDLAKKVHEQEKAKLKPLK